MGKFDGEQGIAAGGYFVIVYVGGDGFYQAHVRPKWRGKGGTVDSKYTSHADKNGERAEMEWACVEFGFVAI